MESQGQQLAVFRFSKSLQSLDAELIQMDESLFQPRREPRGTDKVVGTMLPWMRKLFALQQFYHQRLDQYVTDHKWMSDEDKLKSWPMGSELMAKRQMLVRILWIGINDEWNLWAMPHLAVCKGWLVVEEQPITNDDRIRNLAQALGIDPDRIFEV